MPRWRQRVPRLDPLRVDLIVAIALTLAAEAQILAGGAATHLRAVPAVIAPAITLAVAARRLYPEAVAVWVSLLASLQIALWGDPQVVGASIAYMCALYGLAVWTDTRQFVAAAAVMTAVGVPVVSLGPHEDFSGAVLFSVIVLVVMVIVRRVILGHEERARMAERERHVLAREAVVEERARIAREMHDAIAHNVSMVVIQAGAERRALEKGGGSPHEVLETIEQIGRTALTEMRRLVGMLRTGPRDPLALQPGLAELAGLAER